MRDFHTDAPRVPLSDARLAEIEAEALAPTLKTETNRGINCSCCGKPLKVPTPLPSECPTCVAMFS